jgi:LEA14-like dessication related protein
LATILLHITPEAKKAIVELLTYYVSGKKSKVEIRLHEKSIPSMPHLSKILSTTFAIEIILPRLSPDQKHDEILETNWPEDDFVPKDGKVGSPSQGCESPVILSATLQILSNTLQIKLFNPLDVPIHVSNLSATAFHNDKHIGDLAAPDDFQWTLDPGVQETPKIPVTWSILEFGLDPLRGVSMIFDGVQRRGEVSVDVTAKATVKMGETELGEIETSIKGIATSLGV